MSPARRALGCSRSALARYAFLAAGWPLPWMRAQLPPRFWRKTVAAAEGVLLTIAASNVLPRAATQAVLVVALASARRVVRPRRVVAVAQPARHAGAMWWRRSPTGPAIPWTSPLRPAIMVGRPPRPSRTPGRPRARTALAVVLTILAALVVWVALVAPYQPNDLTLNAFFRIPLEGLVLIAVAAVLPRTPRRILAVSCGLVLALVVVLKVINYEMFTLYDRPYDPLGDTSQLGNGIETLRSLVGGTETKLIEVGAVVGTVVLAVVLALAMLRLTRVAAEQPPLGAAGGHRARRRVGTLLGVRRSAHLPHADRVHALRQSGRQRGQCASGGHPRQERLRQADQARPATQHPRQPAADQPARQGRPARVRRGLRPTGRGGQIVLAGGRRRPGRGEQAAGERRLLVSQRVPRLGDVRRHQLAGALEPAGGTLGRQPGPLQPADIGQALHARTGVQGGRVADRRRRSIERPPVATGEGVLPLRPDLQPLSGRLSRPHLHLRVDAGPVHVLGAPTARAREASPQAVVRGGGHDLEPHAVEPHPAGDRLESGRERLDLQQDSDDP